MTRTINNEEYELNLKNPKNIEMMDKAASCYTQYIPVEDLHQCKCLGLWEALKNYKKELSTFHTYLVNNVRYQCLKYLSRESKQKNILCEKPERFTAENNDIEKLDLIDFIESLPNEQVEVVKMYIFYNMTPDEIVKNTNFSKNIVIKHIKNSLKILSRFYKR